MQKHIIKKVVVLILFFFCSISAVFSQTYVNKEWSISDGNPLMLQWSNSIDISGRLITVGNTQVTGQGANILLTKYTSTGSISWSVNYNTGGTKNDYGTNLTYDASGNIYVCGMTDNNGISNYDIVVLKYSSTGTLLWDTTYDSPSNMNDLATSIVVDTNNNIYVAGSSEGSTTQFDFIALKYNSSGVYQWVSRYDYAHLQDYGGGMTLYNNTYLYVTGASASSANNWDYTTVEYDLTGAQISVVRNSVAGSGYDQPFAYAKDNSGNMYITGKGSTNGTDYDMKTIKLTPALAIDWDVSFDNAGLEDVGNAIAIDNSDNILVGGYTTNSAYLKEAKLIKYDNAGNAQWTYERHSDFPTGNAEVKAIDIDVSDNVFICVENQGYSSKDIAVIKLDGSGSPQWERRIQTNHNETPTGIKVFDDGSIYVTYVENLGVSNTYTVVKYTEHTADTSMFYTDSGRVVCMKQQLIVKFKNSAINKDAIDNTIGTAEVEFANIDYFLETTANDDFNTALSDLCGDMENGTCPITTTRIYPTLKTTDTTSLTRQGTTIPFSDYWTTLLLEVPDGISIQDVKDRLDVLDIVDYCEANTFARLFSGANDSWYSDQHSLHNAGYPNADINVEPAWDIVPSGGKKFVRVGAVDDYCSWSHEDFGYDGVNPVTTKLNGWNLHLNWNIKNDTLATPTADFAHGTLCLGTIGAIRNNGIHIAGIAGGNFLNEGGHLDDGVSLFCLESYTGNYKLDTGNYVQLKDLANAVLMASVFDSSANYKYGLDIENLSWGMWPSKIANLAMTVDSVSTTLSRAIHGANRNLTTLVTARGHSAGVGGGYLDSVTTPSFPACFDDDWVINTGGTNEYGEYETGMGQGFNMDISAPAWGLLTRSIYGESENSYYGETSAAAAHVSGVAGLLMTYMNAPTFNYKNLSPEDVENIVQLTATDINTGGYDSLNGYGRLNAGKALQLVEKPSNTLYHFGTDGNANCTQSINLVALYTGDTITITEPYENEALMWFKKGKYIVNTHQLTLTATYSLNANDTIVSYWPRPSSSNTFLLFNANNVLIPHEKLNILSCTNTQTVTRGYCYQVFDTLGNPLGWWPKNIPALIGNGALKSEFSILAHDKTSWANGTPQIQINDNKISIYPNPTSAIQYIEILSTKVEPVRIELLDMTGRKLSSIFTGKTIVGNIKIPAYLSVYSSGMYQYRIQIGNSSKTIKINKQ